MKDTNIEHILDSLIKSLEQGHSEKLKEYFSVMSRFHNYSLHNQMMIFAQSPTSSMVAGFVTWKKQFERYVKKGEKGIMILAPQYVKKIVEKKNENGETVQEEIKHTYFKPVYVFDVSQTEGKPLPDIGKVSGNPGNYKERIKDLIKSYGIALIYEPMPEHTNGYSIPGEIHISSTLEPTQETSTLIHELAHELLHQRDKDRQVSKAIKETEAVAYIVCTAIGLQHDKASDYIQLWNGNKDTLKASLELISATAQELLSRIFDSSQERLAA